jgi:predicted nucleic acid-binding Zn ribbon protein
MRRRAPRPAAEALRTAIERAAPKTRLAEAQLAWEDAVGPELAAQAQPVGERDGELLVNCASATWTEELDLMQSELLERLSERLGEAAPARIRFLTRPPE